MTAPDADRSAFDSQQHQWGRTYGENPDMFGKEASYPALKAAIAFGKQGVRTILELGSGQGRDTLFFARHGFRLWAVDYSHGGLLALRRKAEAAGMAGLVTTIYHDVRQRFPFEDNSFDGCYSHMLYCMALTTGELQFLSAEIHRLLKPGSLNIYTVRHTGDPHYHTGLQRGDDLWEIEGGFIVHFFNREKIERLAKGFEIVEVEEFEETKLPKKLFLVTLRKS